MKEAAGEANMTVITIILIGVIAAVAIPIVNDAMKSTKEKADCNNAGMIWDKAASTCKAYNTTNA